MNDINVLRSEFRLSQNKSLAVARYFSKRFDIPRDPYLQRATQKSNTLFADHFETTIIAGHPAVVAVSCDDFIDEILRKRRVSDTDNVFVRFGFDSGRGKLSSSLSLIRLDSDGNPLPSNDVFLETSV